MEGQALEKSIPGEVNEPDDVMIVCIDCNSDFVWTSGEQAFFRDKNLQNPPKRCKECKHAKNERIAAIARAQITGIKQKIEVAVKCAKCEATTTVPFYPSQGRPVYCRSCFLEMNSL
jgi:CxxC-x17-CxxC domain-containing protein